MTKNLPKDVEETLAEQFGGDVWITRDRRRIPLRQMDTSHVKNALAFCKRQKRIPHICGGCCGNWAHCTPEKNRAWIARFESELRRRGVW